MKRLTTTLCLLLIGMCFVGTAFAQPQQVTARQIHDIPDENITALLAGGENLTGGEIQSLILNDLVGDTVQVVVVLLSDPLNSGLGNLGDGVNPDRVHVFSRDTSAVSQGVEGMGLQIVDGAKPSNLLNFGIGDVLKITGPVNPFIGSNTAVSQISPETIEFLGTREDLALPESLMDPVVLTTDDANMAVGSTGGVQVNWNNLENLRAQFVRVEGATLQTRSLSNPDRPDFYVSSDGGTTVLNFYDTSIRFRNDRGDYPEQFNRRDSRDDFAPPPPGAVVNIQGFLTAQPFADQLGRSVPADAFMSISPMEDRGCDDPSSGLRCDLEITELPPSASAPTIAAVPAADAPGTVTTTATADPARTIAGVTLSYFTSADTTVQTLMMTDQGDGAFSADIPGQAEGTFVMFWATPTDNTGASTTSDPREYRVLSDGIDEIADLQESSGFAGDASPFAGHTLPMNLTATVQNNPALNGREIAIQDDSTLAIRSGITVNPTSDLTADLQPGDVINITEARVLEDFGVTQLRDLVYTTTTEGGDILPYKEMTTDMLQDPDSAEAHEGMLVTFDDVVITSTNPDDPSGPFGEWSVSSDGTTDNDVRVDDRSNGIDFGDDDDPSTVFSVGERLDFIRGVWWFSFGNYKLMPDDLPNDVGAVINVATEDVDVPGAFALRQNYPNPFNPATTIEYTVPATGKVRLEVYDMLGRSVAVLVDAEQTVGTHTVRFDAARLASGLYLYRLTAGSNVQVKKMMLIK